MLLHGPDTSFDYSAVNIAHDASGCASFDFVKHGEFVTRISLSVNGDHNVSNALSALAVADVLKISVQDAGGRTERFPQHKPPL